MRKFAEEELIIPSGKFKDRRFRVDRQPYAGLWLDLVDSGQWNRFVCVGPSQSGKTLTTCCLPLMYHLFEMQETVVFGLYDDNMANDKWQQDILPAIAASRYRSLLPEQGEGSRNGKVRDSVLFKNGALLKFMSAGGSDKSRSGFTSRVLVVTEANAFDTISSSSKEGSKLEQLIARTVSFGEDAVIYLECTVEDETCLIWREYQAGTATRIAMPCWSCKQYVTLDRDCLQGWSGAETIMEAAREAHWICPSCGSKWTDDQRAESARKGIVVHSGQMVDENGVVQGGIPDSDTMSFRWSAPENLFRSAGEFAKAEWRKQSHRDEDAYERKLLQFDWGIPTPKDGDQRHLKWNEIVQRVSETERRAFPDDYHVVTMGVDIGLKLVHWVAVAWRLDGTGRVVDYGKLATNIDAFAPEAAIKHTLDELKLSVFQRGFERDRGVVIPEQCWIDTRYYGKSVRLFCMANREHQQFRAIQGFTTKTFTCPKTITLRHPVISDEYYIENGTRGSQIVKLNADFWKTAVWDGFNTPMEEPGSLTLFRGDMALHAEFAKHVTAERSEDVFVQGVGWKKVWIQEQRNNHYGDCMAYARAAAHFCGVRILAEPQARIAKPAGVSSPGTFRMDDGRSFSALGRR